MFPKMTHGAAQSFDQEIQFRTPFGYMFEPLARHPQHLLEDTPETIEGLEALGDAMADPGEPGAPHPELDSEMPAIMTYFGQFIDHDLTANTDRDGEMTNRIKDPANLSPIDIDDVVGPEPRLVNGRRPQLDLDSVYGDGPGMIGDKVHTHASELYDHNLDLKVVRERGYVDLRRVGRDARIADLRNDENVIVSQFHAAMLMFHNAVAAGLRAVSADGPTPAHTYARARQLVRWAYQYIVMNEYLPGVCDRAVVEDIRLNGPRFFGPGMHATPLFMPMEFSVAGFRYAHSMIRPFYRLNERETRTIFELLGPARERSPGTFDPLESHGEDSRLKPDYVVEWGNFVPALRGQHQLARRIDPLLANGLFRLDEALGPDRGGDNLARLARSNLLRGYLLRIPSGQSVAKAFGIRPLSGDELDENDKIGQALDCGSLRQRTPLWYYVLREAKLHNHGHRLGAVGSRIVAETLVGLIKQDPNSYWNNAQHPAIQEHGIEIVNLRRDRKLISTLADLLDFAEVPL